MIPEQRRQEIRDLYAETKSVRKTAKKARISTNTVLDIVHNRNRRSGKKRGPRPILSARDKRTLIRTARKGIANGEIVNSRILKKKTGLPASRRTLRRELQRHDFSYQPVPKRLPLTKNDKKNRLEFAKHHITRQTDFKTVVFSDEKRFSLDGPDNLSSYVERRDGKKVLPHRKKRQMRGGGVMILGAISGYGNLKIKFIDGHYDSFKYKDDLENTFLPWCRKEYKGKKFIWQQDGSRVHTAGKITDLLVEKKVEKLVWPVRSPDLSIIENVWNLVEQQVYAEKQFDTIPELKDAIDECARNFDRNTIKKLYDSIYPRLIKVVEGKGNQVD